MQVTVIGCDAEVPRFPIGRLVATPNALGTVSEAEIIAAITRHLKGDWGDLCPEDASANNRALITGERLLSAYHTAAGARFWVLTEADRSLTTVLLPEDY